MLRYQRGLFLPETGMSSLEKAAAEAKADQVFLELLHRFSAQGRNVSATPTSPTYAPAAFAKDPEFKGVKKEAFAEAMRRLFASNKIRVEPYGRPSREYSRIAEND